MSQRIPQILYGSWGLLGFYRGIKFYDFELNDPNYHKKSQDLYSDKIRAGALGTVVYIFPFFCVFPAVKEIHRLEIYLRDLEEERKKPEYYNLF